MTLTSALLLATSTAIFVGAASAAKSWAMSANSSAWLVLTLILYTLGNVIMLRLIRDVGMGVALSLSAVVQLVAVNLVALAFFGERLSGYQSVGIILAVIALALITLAPGQGSS
jgi:small multidrug resistance pump